MTDRKPLLLPLGDGALLVRFADMLADDANRRAVAVARRLVLAPPPGVLEVVPSLVSVLLRYDPARIGFDALAGELRLRLGVEDPAALPQPRSHEVGIRFGGADGPDLEEAAAACGLGPDAFVDAHNAAPLRVLATGFAPGFVYCGLHPEPLRIPRRRQVRARVPAGTVLFAAGQTAITATPIPTGWHIIGRTALRNFDPDETPPTRLDAGDLVRFRAAS